MIKRYIDLFTYDPIQTILNIMEYRKITQLELANRLNMNERSVRKYFSRKTKLSKHFLIVLCVIAELPSQVTFELFKICKLEITLLDDGPNYFEFIKNMGNNSIEENLKLIFQNNL